MGRNRNILRKNNIEKETDIFKIKYFKETFQERKILMEIFQNFNHSTKNRDVSFILRRILRYRITYVCIVG